MDMVMVMGGAITAVAATTTVGIEATTMAGGIIAIGGDSYPVRHQRISANRTFCPWSSAS
jgi:hypothetical protein